MTIRQYAIEWIERLPRGEVFQVSDLYKYLDANFATECEELGLTTDGEPKWQKDARWAVQDCKHLKEIRHAGTSGHWQRL
jgi:hypothetical protein